MKLNNIKSNAPLLSDLLSLTILRTMISYELLDKKLESEIKKIQINAEKLVDQRSQDKTKRNSCNKLIKKIQDELKQRDELKVKLSLILDRL